MCVSLVALTTYPSVSDGTSVQLTVIVVDVLLTRIGGEGVNPGADRITNSSYNHSNRSTYQLL